ncbi:MAG: hypothetical protein O2955_18830 [Planctomycetota bacterium]|nr:hypothetical protein [Planctomycetota bacterium]MDA1214570.1 hypothetical protein [Planctomycetota bacterium]
MPFPSDYRIPYPDGPTFHDFILLLDETPLIRQQATDCPTCEQLLQVGCGRPELAAEFANAINRLTVDEIGSASSDWVQVLFPVISLLSRGLYLITVDEYIPTDGDGNFFWGAFQSIRRCSALSRCVDVTQRPVFLAPTQPTSCFQHASLSRAQQEFPQKPGLTLQLSGKISALLDGHHRALCAALQHAMFPCITISNFNCSRYAADYGALGPLWNTIPLKLRKQMMLLGEECMVGGDERSQSEIDEFVRTIESMPTVDLPAEVQPQSLKSAYPNLDAVTGLDICSRKTGVITDKDIEDILNRQRDDHYYYDNVIPLLLWALCGFRDNRCIDVLRRVAKDVDLRPYWHLAYQLLATMRCEEVDDFFVAYLCSEDAASRPELIEIIDDYFRQPP